MLFKNTHPLVSAHFPEDVLRFAVAGGEDYELLFTAPGKVVEGVQSMADCPITVIGEIVRGEPGEVTLVDEDGSPLPWDDKKGWEHFTRSENH